MNDQEYAKEALLRGRFSPQELVCVDEKSAKKVRFALYGLRDELSLEYPEIKDLIIKVKGTVVHIASPEKRILGLRPAEEA